MDFKIFPARPDGIHVNLDFWVRDWDELAVLMVMVDHVESDVAMFCGGE